MNGAARYFQKPYRWAKVYAIALAAAFALALANDFAVPRAYSKAPSSEETDLGGIPETDTPAEPIVTASSYEDGNISVHIAEKRIYGTTAFIADIQLKGANLLKAAFAGDSYGRNITELTSEMAVRNNAILAINGDYYGFSDTGFVLRNGVLYRKGEGGRALLLDKNGDMHVMAESGIGEEEAKEAWQIWSFGPALVVNGEVLVDRSSEVTGRSSSSNPRTAIGQAGPGHYVFIVSNGRMEGERGLSLEELAQAMLDAGCQTAYNLDGGGSSAMVFNGKVLNSPTTGGRKVGERAVSDIVYIGY
jgi:exopolysaccharide biosynthesis protein